MLNVIENINLATPLAGGGIQGDVTGGLALRWTYGGITGSQWTDLSGNDNHGYKSGSGTLTDSGSQYGYKFDGNVWFEVPTTTANPANQYRDAEISGFPAGAGSTVIYYGLLVSGSDQYLWNRSQVSQSFGSGGGNAGWGHVIGLEATQSSNRAPQNSSPAFSGETTSGLGFKYSISQIVDAQDPAFAVDTPFFKGAWSMFPSSSNVDQSLVTGSFEDGIPVFVVFRDTYVTQQNRYPNGINVQTSGSATFDINVKPPNESTYLAFDNDTQTAVSPAMIKAGNRYLYSRNTFNNNNVAPVNYILGKSQYYISSSIGGYEGTLLETRIYTSSLSDSEVYRVCNAIRQNLQVSGSFL